MKNQTKQTTMPSIQSQVTETMKQSFIETRKVHSKDEILSHLENFASRKARKAWLSKRINDRVVYLQLLQQASTEGWRHFYGQPIHQKFVELQMATLQAMLDIRVGFEPKSERNSLKENFLQHFFGGSEAQVQPKVVTEKPKQAPASTPKQASPKQPKVEKPSAENQVLLELTKSVTALASQMASLTEMVQNNSKAIAELQSQPKVVEKVVKQPKVVATQPKVEKKEVSPKQPKVAKKQPKVASSQISIFDAIWKTNAPKEDKKSTISHKDAFELKSWKQRLMEVK
jgi:hypothetical protein